MPVKPIGAKQVWVTLPEGAWQVVGALSGPRQSCNKQASYKSLIPETEILEGIVTAYIRHKGFATKQKPN